MKQNIEPRHAPGGVAIRLRRVAGESGRVYRMRRPVGQVRCGCQMCGPWSMEAGPLGVRPMRLKCLLYILERSGHDDECNNKGQRVANLSKLLRELSRRRVFRTVVAYLVVLWALSQGAADLFPAFGLPEWSVRAFVIGGVALIPVVALLSWRFNLTTKGIVPDPFGDPGVLADEDLQPSNAAEWAANRHDARAAGYVTAIWTGPDGEPVRKQFFDPFVIGRDPGNDVQLADRRVSRVHAVVFAEDGVWKARDIKSSNGSFLDGRKIAKAELPCDCQLRFHPQGPIIELSIHKVEKTAMTRDAMTRVGPE